MTDLRYPIGRFQRPEQVTEGDLAEWIQAIVNCPSALREAVAGLDDAQLNTPYRDGGWTVRQVVHHVADSHMNSYIRFRLALTEDVPTIKGYDEGAWSRLPDAMEAPVEASLSLLEGMHDRWVHLLRSMSREDFRRTVRHPESGLLNLEVITALYAWHSQHHVAHTTGLRQRMGW